MCLPKSAYQSFDGISRYPILLVCYLNHIYFPLLYWFAWTIVFANLGHEISELVIVPYLVHTPYGNTSYFTYLICRPAIIFPTNNSQ